MTIPQGYRFAATYAGIRKVDRDDVALMVSDRPAATAAVFTRNLVKAAPLVLSARHLVESKGWCRAIVVNAGNANCATPDGPQVAARTARAAAAALGVRECEVGVSSTGVIGVSLPVEKLVAVIPGLVTALEVGNFDAASRAIMTTDTVPKTAAAEVKVKGGTVRIAGMCKGSGMIHPGMATMLAYVFTDAKLTPPEARAMLRAAAEESFGRISVDGDMSTNDTVYLMANGASGIAEKVKVAAAVREVMIELARAIARDGEGARKLITIDVTGAASDRAATQIARAIANSPLCKTAMAGSDPNWGRILCAAGYSGASFDPARVDIDLNGFAVCRHGKAAEFSEEEVKRSLDAPDVSIRLSIRGKGRGKTRFWTCDLTEGYIKINASYRT